MIPNLGQSHPRSACPLSLKPMITRAMQGSPVFLCSCICVSPGFYISMVHFLCIKVPAVDSGSLDTLSKMLRSKGGFCLNLLVRLLAHTSCGEAVSLQTYQQIVILSLTLMARRVDISAAPASLPLALTSKGDRALERYSMEFTLSSPCSPSIAH